MPLQRLSKASQKAVALLAFILLRAFPARSAERPSPLAPLSRVTSSIVSLAGHDRGLRLSVLPDPGVGVVSLETASLPEVSPVGRPPMRKPLRRWVMGSPRGRRSVTRPPAPRFAPPRLSTFQLSGSAFRAASCDSVSPDEEDLYSGPENASTTLFVR